jgi:Ca2+-binding RTX toxin-like protein
VDTVYAYRDYVLSDNIENLVNVVVRNGQKLTGNTLGNRLEGFTGGEIFEGGKGDDLIVTGGGVDRVVYNAGDGHDTVEGFDSGDMVELRGIRFASFAELQARLTVSGSDVLLDLGTNQSITFRNTSLSALAQKNFAFEQGTTNVSGKGIDPYYKPSESGTGTIYEPPLEEPEEPTTPTDPDPEPETPVKETKDLFGGSSADVIVAKGTEAFTIKGNAGNDRLFGAANDDALHGDAGNDTLAGRGGDDKLYGGVGHDRLLGEDGNDVLDGGDGVDRLFGGTGQDVLYGGIGNDVLMGDAGNDKLFGGDGNDVLNGGIGNDVLDGGTGSDMLFGGGGADLFVVSLSDSGSLDRIRDFSHAQGDRIDLSQVLDDKATASNLQTYVDLTLTASGMYQLRVDFDGAAKGYAPVMVAQIFGATSATHLLDAIEAGTFDTVA